MSYFEIYKKRANRWGNTYQERLFNMRAQNFENQLKSSVYLVDFPYKDRFEQGEFTRYKQDETETLHYLLTRHTTFLEPGTILPFLNARKETNYWMVMYLEEQPARGYNKYILLKLSYTANWEDTTQAARSSYVYFFTGISATLKDTIVSSGVQSILFENDNSYHIIMPHDNSLEKDSLLEINGKWYRVLGCDDFSTKGIQYVTVDPTYRKDTSSTPQKTENDSAEDFFWLNGGELNGT